MSVLDKLKELDKQREQLLADAKKEALAKAEAAVKELNDLGYNYSLTEGTKPTKRRTGVRDSVLATIKKHPKGINRAALLDELNLKGDKSGENSVSNAVSALKKAGKITADDGQYKAT